MAKITVIIENGKVTGVDGIPEDIYIEVRNYDIGGLHQKLLSEDESGKTCEVREWRAAERLCLFSSSPLPAESLLRLDERRVHPVCSNLRAPRRPGATRSGGGGFSWEGSTFRISASW